MKIISNASDAMRFEKPNSVDIKAKTTQTTETEATKNSPSASVQLSKASIKTQASDMPFNSEKVEQIKQAIREGRFNINAEKIADKLLQLEEDLQQA